jgi:hypothetical protein
MKHYKVETTKNETLRIWDWLKWNNEKLRQ